MSFAFNLVDGGGLLGFRLDKEPASKDVEAAAVETKPLRLVTRKPSAPVPLGAVRIGKGTVDVVSMRGRSASMCAVLVCLQHTRHTSRAGERCCWLGGVSAGSRRFFDGLRDTNC